MSIFTMRNPWKLIFFSGLCLMMVIVGIGLIWQEKKQDTVSKDDINATQVSKLVSNDQVLPASSMDFFIEYRLERERIRSEKTDLLREMIKNAKSDQERSLAQEQILRLLIDKQRESEMENLIRSYGFTDALVFVRDTSVNAVIKSSSLAKEEVLRIAGIISNISGVSSENITITAKP